jgi:hypothetical protein
MNFVQHQSCHGIINKACAVTSLNRKAGFTAGVVRVLWSCSLLARRYRHQAAQHTTKNKGLYHLGERATRGGRGGGGGTYVPRT